MKQLKLIAGLAVLLFTMGCKSYEDSFNRNLDSTGLYVTNSASNTISMFGADPKSGILNDLGTVAAGTTPVYIALNSAGTFAYVVNSGSNDVYVYSIDKKSRKLTLASTVTAGTTPRMIALYSNDQYAYVVNKGSNDVSKYIVDATTGALSSLGAPTSAGGGTSPVAIAITTNYITIADDGNNSLRYLSITPSTGATTLNVAGANLSAGGIFPRSITVSSGSAPYVYVPTNNNTIEYFVLSNWPGATAIPGTLASIATGTTPVHLALNSSQTQAFVPNYTSGTISMYSISGGALTASGTVTTCSNPLQIMLNSSNFAYLACSGENKINAYSVTSSSLTLVGSYATGTTPTSVAGY